jgi:cytochrome oxidase assembly protein ShyY1
VYRFAFRGRYLVAHLVVLALAATFVRLGVWQLDRRDQVRSRNAMVAARLGVPPASVETLLARDPGLDRAAYRRVVVAGRYRPGWEARVRFRSLGGAPGEYVLGLLVTPSGRPVLVNRGWVPLDTGSSPSPPPPPEGPAVVTGLLLPSEAGGRVVEPPTGGSPAAFDRIDVRAIGGTLPVTPLPLYLQLREQRPPGGPLPVPLPEPALDEGPHLSYAVQWFLFTAIGLVGWPLLLRRTARSRARRGSGEEPVSPPAYTRSR